MEFNDTERIKEAAKILILKHAMNNNEVIYGARAVNVNLPQRLRKKTEDYDVYTENPKKAANSLRKELNKEVGRKFIVRPATHAGTYKVINRKTKIGIADYTKQDKDIKTIKINGTKYADTAYLKADVKANIANEFAAFRREKDIDTEKRLEEGGGKWF